MLPVQSSFPRLQQEVGGEYLNVCSSQSKLHTHATFGTGGGRFPRPVKSMAEYGGGGSEHCTLLPLSLPFSQITVSGFDPQIF